jgi:NitT/TauT family transport system permease protein
MSSGSISASSKRALANAGSFFTPIFIFLLIWEFSVRSGWVAANIFPSPSMIISRTVDLLFSSGPDKGMLAHNIWASLYRALTAFVLSLLIAIPLGFLLGISQKSYKWVSPVLSLMLPLPAVAWTPILLVAFGQGDKTIISVCFLGAFFPVLYSTIQGVRSVSKQSVWVIRSMGGNNRWVFFNVLLPASMPALISGLKLGMAHSWRTLVAAEMLAALGAGLGFMIFAARNYMDVTTMFVGIAFLAIIGMAIEYGIFGTLEKLTVRKWHGRSKVGGEK